MLTSSNTVIPRFTNAGETRRLTHLEKRASKTPCVNPLTQSARTCTTELSTWEALEASVERPRSLSILCGRCSLGSLKNTPR